MHVRLLAALVVLPLSGCASHEGPNSTIYTQPDAPHAEVTVAVASVQLVQDCPDPPAPVAADAPAPAVAADAPAPAIMQKPTADASHAKRGAEASGGWSPPCTQSTLQLSLRNTGAVAGKLQLRRVRLLDAASQREVGTLSARRPGLWSADGGAYRPWDETVADGATLQVTYALGDPAWAEVQQRLKPDANIYANPFVLEIEVSVDGRNQTVRSPEFVRQEVFVVVT